MQMTRFETAQAAADFITGWSAEKENKLRSDMLCCTYEDLFRVADVLDGLNDGADFCVVCGKDALSGFGDADVVIP